MSAKEFRESGLDKLSAEELANLNEWLRGRRALSAGAASAAGVEDRRGFVESYDTGDAIVSRIVGEFRGWSGTKSQFRLENGQVWQSTDPAAKLAVSMQNPTVRIEPGVLNAWFLSVEGYNSNVRVKRIK